MGNKPFKNSIVYNNINEAILVPKVRPNESTVIRDFIQADTEEIIAIKKELGYEYVVFSGGGIKGISYCGAIEVLNKLNILDKIKGFAGTSAGSIVASLLAIGYNSYEIKKIMFELDMASIVDGTTSYLREGINLVESYGFVPGNYVNGFLGKLIKDKTGSEDYSIEQLYSDKNIELIIVATDMNISRSRYFFPTSPNESDRKISIRQAIRMSMGIPFLFEPIVHSENLHVDGGILDNYPIHVFDGTYPGDILAKNHMVKPNAKVLGLQIMTCDQIKKLEESPEKIKIDSILHYGLAFISAFMAENDRRELTPHNKFRTIRIITPYYNMDTFTISNEEKNNLIECGRHATVEYFIDHLNA